MKDINNNVDMTNMTDQEVLKHLLTTEKELVIMGECEPLIIKNHK